MGGQGRRFTHGVPDMGSAAELRESQAQWSARTPPDDYTPPRIPKLVTVNTGQRYHPTSWTEKHGRISFRFDMVGGKPARGVVETTRQNIIELKYEGDE